MSEVFDPRDLELSLDRHETPDGYRILRLSLLCRDQGDYAPQRIDWLDIWPEEIRWLLDDNDEDS
jgi:hypothetical protein